MEDLPLALLHYPSIHYSWIRYVSLIQEVDQNMTLKEVALGMKEKGTREEMTMFVLLTQGFWYRRNKMMHENVCMDPNQMIEYVLSTQNFHTEMRQAPSSQPKTSYR